MERNRESGLEKKNYLLRELGPQELSGEPPTPSISQKYCRTNGRCTAVQVGGILQYKWEVYCWVSLSSSLRSQEGPAIQMGGVLPYEMEVYCSTFFSRPV